MNRDRAGEKHASVLWLAWGMPMSRRVPVDRGRIPSELVEVIRPSLHHANAFFPVFTTGINASDRIGIQVRELSFYRVRRPPPRLIEQGARHGPKAIGRHPRPSIAETLQGKIECVLTHGTIALPLRWKEITPLAGRGPDFVNDNERLFR